MSDLITSYENTYGSAAKVFLRTLGGDPDKIIREVEEMENEPDPFAGNPFFAANAPEAEYNKCRNCGECDLNAEGWKCSYIYEQAQKYIKNHPENSAAQHKGA